jgi:hypothetical protein
VHAKGIAKHAGVEKFVDERALLEADGTAFKPQAAALQRCVCFVLGVLFFGPETICIWKESCSTPW